MAKRDHYLPADIVKSTRTKFVQDVTGFRIYSHTISNIVGTHIVLWNDDEWPPLVDLESALEATIHGNMPA